MFGKRDLKKLRNLVITVILTLGFSISLQSLLAAWTAPTSAPPQDNVGPPIFNEHATPATSALIDMPLGMGGAITIDQGWGQSLTINSNQIWKTNVTGDKNLYLQWSNVGGAVQIGSSTGVNNNLNVYGNVGFGASAANKRLLVADPSNDSQAIFFKTSAANAYLEIGANDSVASLQGYQWSGTPGPVNLVMQTAGGNVGIGETDPDSKLHIKSSVNQDGITIQTDNNANDQGIAYLNSGGSYTWHIFRHDASATVGANRADLKFAEGLGDIDSLVDRLVLEADGDVSIPNTFFADVSEKSVGIGKTPDADIELDVSGDIQASGDICTDAGHCLNFVEAAAPESSMSCSVDSTSVTGTGNTYCANQGAICINTHSTNLADVRACELDWSAVAHNIRCCSVIETANCISHHSFGCHSEDGGTTVDLYWRDSCGNWEDFKTDCVSNQCKDDMCYTCEYQYPTNPFYFVYHHWEWDYTQQGWFCDWSWNGVRTNDIPCSQTTFGIYWDGGLASWYGSQSIFHYICGPHE